MLPYLLAIPAAKITKVGAILIQRFTKYLNSIFTKLDKIHRVKITDFD
jgi:hypothetical protein